MILAVQVAWVLISIIAVLMLWGSSVVIELNITKKRLKYAWNEVRLRDQWLKLCVNHPIVKGDEFIVFIPQPNTVYPHTNADSIVMNKHKVTIVRVLDHYEWRPDDRCFVVESHTNPNMNYFTVWESELRPKE